MSLLAALGAGVMAVVWGCQAGLMGMDPLRVQGYVLPVLIGAAWGAGMSYWGGGARKREAKRAEEVLPVCCYCQKVRPGGGDADDPAAWISAAARLAEERGVMLSHGMCPECVARHHRGVRRIPVVADPGEETLSVRVPVRATAPRTGPRRVRVQAEPGGGTFPQRIPVRMIARRRSESPYAIPRPAYRQKGAGGWVARV